MYLQKVIGKIRRRKNFVVVINDTEGNGRIH
jgi:hypothetical protein